MRLIKTIAWFVFAFWSIQLVLFVLLFASAFTHLIVQGVLFVFRTTMPQSSLDELLIRILKVLTWPTRLLVSQDSFAKTPVSTILLTAVNSLIWGVPLGALLTFARAGKTSKSKSTSST